MSVINKMLRDLDTRQTQGVSPAAAHVGQQNLMRGTSSVAAAEAVPGVDRRRYVVWAVMLVLLVGAILLAQSLAGRDAGTATPTAAAVVAAPATVVVDRAATAPAPVASVSAPAMVSTSAAPAPAMAAVVALSPPAAAAVQVPASAAAPLRIASAPAKPPAPSAQAVATALVAPVPVAAPAPVVALARPASAPQPAAVAAASASRPVASVAHAEAPPARSTAPVVATEPAPLSRQTLVLATLGQAQGLWNAGARQGAIDLLRDAVTSATRADAPAAGDGTVPALVRELARMQLAQGQVGPVLELLIRLEPALSGQADLWAVRGNAAQRLGRYAESASAYQVALKLRPDEARWMLALAVSLAADGQPAAALPWAERARDAGPLAAEVQAYLRQMGVVLRER